MWVVHDDGSSPCGMVEEVESLVGPCHRDIDTTIVVSSETYFVSGVNVVTIVLQFFTQAVENGRVLVDGVW